MKINRNFLGVMLGLGLTFGLSFAASAYTLLPPTNSIKISLNGKQAQGRFIKGTNFKDCLATYIVFNKAFKKMGREGKKLDSSLRYEMMTPIQELDHSRIYLDSKVPGSVSIDFSDKKKIDVKEKNKNNAELVKVLNEVKEEITKKDFKLAVGKIKKYYKSELENEHYSDKREKEAVKKVIKKLAKINYKDIKNLAARLNFKVKRAPKN